MVDLSGSMRLSERRNARVTLTPQPPATTITISSVTVTLYDSSGNIAGGVSALTASFDSGAQAAPRCWYLLRPSVLAIVAGIYTLAFVITDASGFVWEPVIIVNVQANNN